MQHIDARMTCGRLSFEDRKLVEIARAMYSDPKVLIIDETTSALSKNGRDILYGLMEKMKSEGKSVIFISHDIDELMEKCDYLTVFRDGIYIDEVPKEKFNADLIKQLMVGREMVGAYYREDSSRATRTRLSSRLSILRRELLPMSRSMRIRRDTRHRRPERVRYARVGQADIRS